MFEAAKTRHLYFKIRANTVAGIKRKGTLMTGMLHGTVLSGHPLDTLNNSFRVVNYIRFYANEA